MSDLHPAHVADIASQLVSLLEGVLLVDEKPLMKATNKDASFITQSGTIQSNGGTTPLWDAGLTGRDIVVGVADTGEEEEWWW